MAYEGNIEGYTFIMKNKREIEVWDDLSKEFPECFIYLREGSITNEKDFHKEISYWWMDNKTAF